MKATGRCYTITVTNCKYCHTQIEWEKENGKYVPYNIDGTRHTREQCEGMKNQGDGKARTNLDSTDLLAQIVTRTNDELVLKIGEYRLDIRKEAK